MKHQWDLGLLLSGLPLCVLSRGCNVFPCSYIVNVGRKYKLPRNLQVRWCEIIKRLQQSI